MHILHALCYVINYSGSLELLEFLMTYASFSYCAFMPTVFILFMVIHCTFRLFGFNGGRLRMDERIDFGMSDPDLVPLIIQVWNTDGNPFV